MVWDFRRLWRRRIGSSRGNTRIYLLDLWRKWPHTYGKGNTFIAICATAKGGRKEITMKKYKSEIGYSFYLMMFILVVVITLSFIFALRGTDSKSETIVLFVAYAIAALAYCLSVIHPLINTQYVVQDKKLEIKSGFYKKTISFNQLVEIIEKKSFGREPALSSKRLYIKYRDGQDMYWIGVSPRDRENFLEDIGHCSIR